jgi:hypothetical protein
MFIPDYLTRYYKKGEYPFLSLNDLPFAEANKVKITHCRKNGIGGFYSQDDYLIHRKEIERWIYKQLISIGGNPKNKVPVYMMLGESPAGDYDIRLELQKNAEEIKIPIREIDLSTVTFTYPDSMYKFVVDANGDIVDGGRTNTPVIYTYQDLPLVVHKFRIYKNYRFNIEAQVWNREMLHKFWMKKIKGENKYK